MGSKQISSCKLRNQACLGHLEVLEVQKKEPSDYKSKIITWRSFLYKSRALLYHKGECQKQQRWLRTAAFKYFITPLLVKNNFLTLNFPIYVNIFIYILFSMFLLLVNVSRHICTEGTVSIKDSEYKFIFRSYSWSFQTSWLTSCQIWLHGNKVWLRIDETQLVGILIFNRLFLTLEDLVGYPFWTPWA